MSWKSNKKSWRKVSRQILFVSRNVLHEYVTDLEARSTSLSISQAQTQILLMSCVKRFCEELSKVESCAVKKAKVPATNAGWRSMLSCTRFNTLKLEKSKNPAFKCIVPFEALSFAKESGTAKLEEINIIGNINEIPSRKHFLVVEQHYGIWQIKIKWSIQSWF